MNINVVDNVDRDDMERMCLQREKQTEKEEIQMKKRGETDNSGERGGGAAKGVLLYVPLAVRILVISSFACANYVTF